MNKDVTKNKRAIIEMVANGQLSKAEGLKKILELREASNNEGNLVYYTKDFMENKVDSKKKLQLGNLLVFTKDKAIENKIKENFAPFLNTLTIVTVGDEFKVVGDTQYQIRIDRLEDYLMLFEKLVEKGMFADNILHLISEEAMDSATINTKMESSIFSMFSIFKALMSTKKGAKVNIIFQYRESNNSEINSAIDGFTKSATIENPNLLYKTISIDCDRKDFNKNILEQLLREFYMDKGENSEIYYKGSKRFVVILKEHTIENDVKENSLLRPNGVFLITGGTGALGYSLAKYLVDKLNASLILSGRSSLNENIKEKINSLKSSTNKIIYIKADISSLSETKNIVNQIKEHFNEVNGIIHCAGTKKDSFIINKEKEEVKEILDTKILGTNNLYSVFKDEDIDFMVLFSSISAVFGNVGQSDYAYANSYMDYFANEKGKGKENKFKVLSINWPLWKDGGMRATDVSQAVLKKNFGMDTLTTEVGMKALKYSIRNISSNSVVLYGEADKIKNMINLMNNLDQGDKKIDKIEQKLDMSNIDIDFLKENTQAYLKDIFIKVTKIPPNALRLDDSFEKIGFDSIMAMSINDELEVNFGEIAKTLLFEYQTLRELSEYFIENHMDVITNLFEVTSKKSKNVNVEDTFSNKKANKEREIPDKWGKHFVDKGRKTKENKKITKDDIAIIGVSGKFPMSKDLQVFWNNLKEAQDCITEVPKGRWNVDEYYTTDKNELGKMYCKWGGFVDDVDKFDALFFNISPREAEIMDPQERMFLECAYNTIEDAGYTRNSLENKKVGVFAGVMYGQYQLLDAEIDGKKIALSSVYASIANRVSYHLNLNGPSIALDTMCSSSLTSIHLACDSIRKGESNYAIAGGVNVSIHPHKYIFLSQQKFAASDGRCRSFGEGGDGYVPGEGGDGYVPGEGVGAVLLKSLDKAIEDGDNIYAVIKGTAINHGGKTTGFTVPNPTMQGAVINETLKESGINPRTINYIEAHGTGTSLGDPIEISGLVKAFKEYTNDKQFCAIGSVKSNIGHCESAAGIAAIIKVILQMKYKKLVPSIHSDELNSNINFETTPFYVQRTLSNWDRLILKEGNKEKVYPRRAGVSSFGAGGANAHILLEEYIGEKEDKTSGELENGRIVVLSARNEERLKVYVEDMKDYFDTIDDAEISVDDIAYTLQIGREPFAERLALVVSSVKEIKELLKEFSEGNTSNSKIIRGNIKNNKEYIEILNSGKEGTDFLDILVKGQNVEKIAQLWVLGLEVEWSKLYEENELKKVSLPTYPFERNRHWVNEVERKEISVNNINPNISKSNSLVEFNLSNIKEYKFSSRYSNISSYYDTYKIHGSEYMNSFGVLAFAREAIELVGYNNDISLENILWSGALYSNHDNSSKINVNIIPKGNDALCELKIAEDNIVLQCNITKSSSLIDDFKSDTEVLKDVIKDDEAIKNLYKNLSLFGINTSYEYVSKLYTDKEKVIALIDLGDKFYDSLSSKVFNLICNTLIATAEKEAKGKIYVPCSIEKMSFKHKELKQFILYIEGSESEKYTLRIIADNNEVVLAINNISFKDINEEEDKSDKVYYTTKWVESSKDIKEKINGDLVIFLDNEEDIQMYKDIENTRTFFVSNADKYGSYGENSYHINFNNKEHYKALINLFMEESVNINKIAYVVNNMKSSISEKINESIYSLLYLTQTLLEAKVSEDIKLLYIFNEQHNAISVLDSAISGFIKTLRLESPNYKFKTVAIDTTIPKEKYVAIMGKEFSINNNELEISYRRGTRLVKRITEVESNKLTNHIEIKQNGVYIITGGTGALGSIFAQYLAEKHNVNLILSGRSTLNKEKIEAIKKYTENVEYIVSDASKEEDFVELIRKVKEHYGRIDGIFHCAGVNNDSFILKKSKEEFDNIISSKVISTLNIDKATKNENLDFIVLFSSITGETGNLGQADYAYANSFMNYFAKYREQLAIAGERKGKTLSIAWPLWESDGMNMSQDQKQILEYQTGLTQLPKEKGIEAFEFLLKNDINPLIVGYGKKNKIRKFLENFNSELEEELVVELETSNIDKLDLLDKTTEYLIEVFSELLKLDKSEIDKAEIFEEYGIESVMIGYFNGKFEDDLGAVSKTLLFEYQTIESLAEYMAKNYVKPLIKLFNLSSDNEVIEEKKDIARKVSTSEKLLTWKKLDPFKDNNIVLPNSNYEEDDIAIIGVSGKYPQADDIYEFWDNMVNKKDCISEIPINRWDYRKYFDGEYDKVKEGKMYSKWGGFIDDVDKFDPTFFNISPREAIIMDPQERVFIETVWAALEDAGYTRKRLKQYNAGYGFNVGVFAGTTTYSYQLWGPEEWERGNISSIPNVSPWSIANRISYILNLSGPSMPVDTACSSSLTAIHLACESLKKKECEMAIAGGVNLYLHPYKYVLMCQTKMLSPTGKCFSFGDDADGFVPGEGVGAIILKPFKKAIKDKDYIYGIIKATEINHGGKANGYTVPNPNAQVSLISKALRKANIDARTVSYIEAHGTGTKLGDPIEINSLNRVFEEYKPSKQSCSIGSVKSNIGHLEAAAGIASITKVLLQLKYKKLVPSINSSKLNSNIDFENSYFHLQRELEPWKTTVIDGNKEVRRAGVSSFGAGGANAYVLIEEYKNNYKNEKKNKDQVIVLSAKSSYSLRKNAMKLYKYLSYNEDYDLSNIAYTLQIGREEMNNRMAFSCSSIEEIKEKLNSFITNINNGEVYFGTVKKARKSGLDLVNEVLEIAAKWVQGVDIDWEKLHKDEDVHIVSLPTYAFERESYWISRTETGIKGAGVEKIHSLIDRNISSLNKQKYETKIEESNCISMKLNNKEVKYMAYSSFIEMFRIASELSIEDSCSVIENVIWGNRTEFKEDRKLITSLYENEDYIECETGYENNDGEYIICSQGQVEISSEKLEEVLDISEILGSSYKDKISNKKSLIQHSKVIEEFKNIYVKDNSSYITVKLKENATLLDSKVKFNYSVVEEVVECFIKLFKKAYNYEFYKLYRCVVAKPLCDEFSVYCKYYQDNDSEITFNLYFIDKNENVLIKIEKLTLKVMKNTSDANEIEEISNQIKTMLAKLQNGEIDIERIKSIMEVSNE
ncbi:SDR family NAD(P)-dependent oxidoreductase [Clostridium estertheticum]|uniref:hybrid non-ribosomal peptide synthetase/type I polyketide synthase n=1 Tax=Clostridium estertheticum TaxID=238834 RepID=UPI0013EE66FD|nr:type I polyketide synthase [Clostridium estertheticum]MBZ9609084.1 SDR family NAD(P)-dependent oxidoreductase [Clostridium estertheticum]